MVKHIIYFWFLILHKFYLLVAANKLNYKYPTFWQILTHDSSKFLPSEWIPYANYFFRKSHKKEEFDAAFKLHIKRNKHHWQHWVINKNKKKTYCAEIPEKYAYEMVCDWAASGKTKNKYWDVKDWYEYNKGKIKLHPKTRKLVEKILSNLKD